jgi:ABC-type multidrug transport system ATPase subunit
MLALAQAFVAQPKVLQCNEPSLGVAQALIPPIRDFLKRWAASGSVVVIVEQQIDSALAVADRAIIMARGRFGWPARPRNSGVMPACGRFIWGLTMSSNKDGKAASRRALSGPTLKS